MTDLKPGAIVGDISLNDPARRIRFGVVQAPAPSERVQRIISTDPEVWRPAVAATVEDIWPKQILEYHRADAERRQLKRWGVTGLDLLNTLSDEEWGRLLGTWQDESSDEDLAEIEGLFAALLMSEGVADAKAPGQAVGAPLPAL
jgi:hypothetical protein